MRCVRKNYALGVYPSAYPVIGDDGGYCPDVSALGPVPEAPGVPVLAAGSQDQISVPVDGVPVRQPVVNTVGELIPPLQPVTDFLAARPLVTVALLVGAWMFRRQLGLVVLAAVGYWLLNRRVAT